MRTRASSHAALGVGAVLLATLTAGCGSQAATVTTRAHLSTPDDPLAGQSFYTTSSPATLEVEQLRAAGHMTDARAMEQIADQPTATWLTGRSGVEATVRELTRRAAAAGKSALLVVYDIPGRDCGGYSAGGAPSAGAYRHWITEVARGIGPRQATVIVEPDAIAQLLTAGCVAAGHRTTRLSLLRFALRTLKAQPHVTAYLDAGNPGWIRPSSRLVPSLRAAGISIANGFALNVANFYTTGSVRAYGDALSDELGGKHFVIDTSRNGRGAPSSSAGEHAWCNPPGRALGHDPTTDTGIARVDAYLWIKQPGASDGACQPGDPPAGRWMGHYALALALASRGG
jgi:endoglucanase